MYPTPTEAQQEQERQSLEAALVALEAQRAVLGDAMVEVAVRPLRQRLRDLAGQTLRQVTVLFLDVVGSTTLSGQLDAEDTAELMNGALARFTATVQAHGGRVFNYAGDSVMAAFGADGAREDDAERGVRCGLALLADGRAVAELVRARHGLTGFDVRVGLHTGEVLLGGAIDVGGGLRGVTVNVAARMEQSAPPGQLRISRDTQTLVRGLFEVAEQPALMVKGVDVPLITYLVRRAAPRAFHGATRGFEGSAAPMVGRERELKLLQGALERLLDQRTCAAITVVAEAGVGKSRLLREFEAWAGERSGFRSFRGRSTPVTQGQPFGLLRDILAWHVQLNEGDTPAQSRHKLATALQVVFPGEDGVAAADILGHLIGLDALDSPHVQGLIASPRQLRGRGFQAVLRLLQGPDDASTPALLVLEDLHWADDATLDFLDFLAAGTPAPAVLVLAFTRPALFERRKEGSSGRANHTRLDLRALDPDASRQLAGALLARLPEIPQDLEVLVMSGADGNPFYMEELVKMLIDQACLVPGAEPADPWTLDRSRLGSTRIPTTLTGILQARLDHLSELERLTLQEASVIGTVFWLQALLALDARAEGSLTALVERELALPRAETSIEGQREYAFKHWILQQVTYATVLKRTRHDLHARLADWLAAQADLGSGEILGTIAEHYERSERLAEAAQYHARAAAYATSRFAHAAALHHTQRGLALAESFPSSMETLKLRWRLLEERELSLIVQGDLTAVRTCIAAAEAVAEALDDDALRARVAVRRCRLAVATGDLATQQAEAEKALAWTGTNGPPEVRLRAMRMLGDARSKDGTLDRPEPLLLEARAEADRLGFPAIAQECVCSLAIQAEFRDRPREALERHKESLALVRAGVNKTELATALSNVGVSWLNLGVLDKARPQLEEALRHCQLTGDRPSEANCLLNLSQLELWEGHLEAAAKHATRAVALADAVEARQDQIRSRVQLGDAEQALGRLDEAWAAHRSALERAQPDTPGLRGWNARAGLGRVALARGDLTEAMAQMEPLADLLVGGQSLFGMDDPRWIELTCHQVLAAAGDARAAPVLEIAHRNVQTAATSLDDEERRSFLHNIPFNRAITEGWSRHRIG